MHTDKDNFTKAYCIPNKIIQIRDFDETINEQKMFINLACIESISFINYRYVYNTETDHYDKKETYSPPKVYIKLVTKDYEYLTFEEFEKYLKPFISFLN